MTKFINFDVEKFNMNIKSYWSDFRVWVSETSRKNKIKRDYRKRLIKTITIDEAEKVYKSYISKDIFYETNAVGSTDKKIRKRLSFNQLLFKIKFKVSNEELIYVIPRLKKIKKEEF